MLNNKQISAHLKMKYDTTESWDASSLVPQLGEPLLYRDGQTGAIYGLKFGDGVHTPANLEFIGNDIVVDSALSATSTNPVQNKIITAVLGGKLDEKSFSNNPPTWVDPTSFIENDSEDANKHRILAGIYAVDENGNQVLVPFSMAGGARQDGYPEGTSTDPNGPPLGIPTFAIYNRANNLLCCKATDEKHAVPLGQLNDLLAGKLDKVAATSANARKLYGTSNAGGSYMWKVLRTVADMQTTEGGIMGRADNGHFVVPTPTANDDIANKKYVDDHAGGATWHSVGAFSVQILNAGIYMFVLHEETDDFNASVLLYVESSAPSFSSRVDNGLMEMYLQYDNTNDTVTVYAQNTAGQGLQPSPTILGYYSIS